MYSNVCPSESFTFLPLLSTSPFLSWPPGCCSLRSRSWAGGRRGRCSWPSWWPCPRCPACRPGGAPCPCWAPATGSSRLACWYGTPRTCPGWSCCWRGTACSRPCWPCAGSAWCGGTLSLSPPARQPRRSPRSGTTPQRGRSRWSPTEEDKERKRHRGTLQQVKKQKQYYPLLLVLP